MLNAGAVAAVVLLALFGIVALVTRLQRARYHRKYPPRPAPEGYSVTLTELGRSGYVDYREGSSSARFDWEFAGKGAVAFIIVPPADDWSARTPFAPHRRDEVLGRVADEVVRQKCRGCTWTIEDNAIYLHE